MTSANDVRPMKTDGIFDFCEIEIPLYKYNKPIHLYAIGDVHRNSPNCDVKKWKEFLAEVKKDRPETYFILVGDLFDSFSTSERKSYVGGDFHESTTRRWEEMYAQDVKNFVKEVEFMKGRTLAVLGGNHYFMFVDGTTTDQWVASELKARYLGCNALIRLTLRYARSQGQQVDICVHHGLGGGRTSGASINKLQQMAGYFDADIYLQGHDHNRCVDYINRLGLSNGSHGKIRLVNKKMLLARTGSFLKAYEPKTPSYAVDAMMPPNDLGALKIILTPTRVITNSHKEDSEDRRWIDVKAEL